MKKYFNFPIHSQNNRIWQITNDPEVIMRVGMEPIKPFTESDFDEYYQRLFSSQFISLISKISTQDLLKNGEGNASFKEDGITYSMYVKKSPENILSVIFLKKINDGNRLN